jgi:hypothetical protein
MARGAARGGVRIVQGKPDHSRDPDGELTPWLYQREQALGWGVLYEEAPLVIEIGPHHFEGAERFSGGVRLRSSFGTVLEFAVWHSISHLTPEGDVAPGFGGFQGDVEDV